MLQLKLPKLLIMHKVSRLILLVSICFHYLFQQRLVNYYIVLNTKLQLLQMLLLPKLSKQKILLSQLRKVLHQPFKVTVENSLLILSNIFQYYLEKTSALVDSSKNALSSSSSSEPTPVAPARTDLITQEAYVTETSGQTAHGPEPVLAASGPATTSKSNKGGPLNAIRNFFNRIFRSQRHEDRQVKSNNDAATTAAVQVTETVTTTTATVATSNPTN